MEQCSPFYIYFAIVIVIASVNHNNAYIIPGFGRMALTEAEFVILGVVGGRVPGGPPGHVLVTIGHYNNPDFIIMYLFYSSNLF